MRQIPGAELPFKWADMLFLASARSNSCTMKLDMMLDPKLADVRPYSVILYVSMLK